MQSLEREPLLESRRRNYGNFSGLGRLNTLADIQSSTSSSTLCEEDDIRVTLDKQQLFLLMHMHGSMSFHYAKTIQQACVFIEDAVRYRSIHHRVDEESLRLYKIYYSPAVQWMIQLTIFVLHMLAFIEYPSSLSWSSDPRAKEKLFEPPCGATESVELLCLLILLVDLIVQSYLRGKRQFLKSKWLMAFVFVITCSLLDWFVSVGLSCKETVRVRRMLRPFFLLQHSMLMKKTVNCLRRTLPQVASVLLLLGFHLYFFTIFGMLLFPKPAKGNTTELYNPDHVPPQGTEQQEYFSSLEQSFISMLVLLTTANNPDVTIPAYSINRLYAVCFIIFLVIGLYCFMNMLTAVIYNQFRGYFLNSMQSSLFRRRLGIRAAFEVLRRRKVAFKYRSNVDAVGELVPVRHLRLVIEEANVPHPYKNAILEELDGNMGGLLNSDQFNGIFYILEADFTKTMRPDLREVHSTYAKVLQRICAHKYFTYFGCLIASINVIIISVELAMEYDQLRKSTHTTLGIVNMVFVFYYLLEQSLKFWALGWKRYRYDVSNLFDGFITVLLVIIEVAYVSTYGFPFISKDHSDSEETHTVSLWDLVRVINMLMMLRLFRLVVEIKPMLIVASTLLDLVKNLKAFAGILVVIYYSYALLGMELFFEAIPSPQNDTNSTVKVIYPCGSYEQLQYWPNNFNDFASSLVLLWDIMVVNNWHVFLDAYSRYVNSWAQTYFIIWWLLSVVICLNLFTALILENFIMRWDRLNQRRERAASTASKFCYTNEYLTVHDMFRGDLQEPSEEALLVELYQHSHLVLTRNDAPSTSNAS